jgi:hypothetical protein
VQTIKIDIAAPRADALQEIGEPAYGVACTADAGGAAADPLFAQGLEVDEPVFGGGGGGHVGLVGEFGLVEGYGCFLGWVGGGDFGGEVFDADGVPLHWDEFEGGGVRGWVRGPVVEPGYFGAGFGEGVDGVFVVGGPAEAAFGGGHFCCGFFFWLSFGCLVLFSKSFDEMVHSPSSFEVVVVERWKGEMDVSLTTYEIPLLDDVASLEVHLIDAILQQSWTCVLSSLAQG